MKKLFIISAVTTLLIGTVSPIDLHAEEASDPAPLSFSLYAGLTFSDVSLEFAPNGPEHSVRSFEIRANTGWRLRAELAHHVTERIGFTLGLGLAEDRFETEETGEFPDPDGISEPRFEARTTHFNMLMLEIPIKIVVYPMIPSPAENSASEKNLYFSMGPKINVMLTQPHGIVSPQRGGIRQMQAPIAFEFGGGVLVAGPWGKRLAVTFDYSIDLTDRIESDYTSWGEATAPYDTWSNLKLQTLAVSVGLHF